MALALLFRETTEYVDRSLATASWWDRYEIKPGLYTFEPVKTVGLAWVPVKDGEIPDCMRVTLTATLVESYRVDRLLSESRENRTHPNRETTVQLSPYPFEVQPGRTLLRGEVVEVHACGDCTETPTECPQANCQGTWL